MTNNECKGPFEGLLVIDMTHVLQGPFGTQLLCNMGAMVIKVEPPGQRDDTRTFRTYVDGQSLYYSFINHGKEIVVLDLKNDHDKSIFINMLKQADVLAENFRPGTMEKLGFSWETLQEINPRLIYASSSGFGHKGPLKDAPAYDNIIQAMSGIMMETRYPDAMGKVTRNQPAPYICFIVRFRTYRSAKRCSCLRYHHSGNERDNDGNRIP